MDYDRVLVTGGAGCIGSIPGSTFSGQRSKCNLGNKVWSEVICIIANPQGRSEIIVLDRTSAAFRHRLNEMAVGRGSDSDTKNKIVGPLYGLLTFEPIPDTKKLIVISKVPEAYDVIERLVLDLDGQEMAAEEAS